MSGRARSAPLPVDPAIHRLRPWYHDFAPLGLRTDFESGPLAPLLRAAGVLRARRRGAAPGPGLTRALARALLGGPSSHRINQPVKEAALAPLLERALAELPAAPRLLELFCADGYHACRLARSRPGLAGVGVDRDPWRIEQARAAARALGLDGLRFEVGDAASFLAAGEEPFDLALCAGGLYHLEAPRALLAALRPRVGGLLVIQSVVSLAREDPGYFETPAPGWRHGSRFSHARLAAWLAELGWRVLASSRGELPGNRRPEDRGAGYFLCGKE